MSDIDTGHPALRSVERFDGVKFYQAIQVNPVKSRVLARLNDGTPLVMERHIGEGKVLAFASTFDNVSNDLPLHAAWVPFVTQTASYLGGGGADQPVNLAVDSYVELRSATRTMRARPRSSIRTASGCCRWKKPLRRTISRSIGKDFSKSRPRPMTAQRDRRSRRPAGVRPDGDPQETLDLWKATGAVDPAGRGRGPANR